MPISTGDYARGLQPISGKWVEAGEAEVPAKYKEVFTMRSMGNRSYIEDILSTGTGLIPAISEGEAVRYDSFRQGHATRYTAQDFGSGVIITQRMLETGVDLDLMARRTKNLGKGAAATKNVVAFNVLNRAFNTSYVGGDGKALCVSDHPVGRAGNISNVLATAQDVSEAALEAMDLLVADFRDDGNLRQNIQVRKLVVPRALRFEVQRILGSVKQPDSVSNNTNALRDENFISGGVVVVDQLSDADAWFVLTSESEQGLTFMERKAEVQASDTDFDTGNAKTKINFSIATGWTNFRHVLGTAGAA